MYLFFGLLKTLFNLSRIFKTKYHLMNSFVATSQQCKLKKVIISLGFPATGYWWENIWVWYKKIQRRSNARWLELYVIHRRTLSDFIFDYKDTWESTNKRPGAKFYPFTIQISWILIHFYILKISHLSINYFIYHIEFFIMIS